MLRARVLGVGSGAWPSCLGPGQGRDFDSQAPFPGPWSGLRALALRGSGSWEGPSGDHWPLAALTQRRAVAAMPAQPCLHCLAITGSPVPTATALGSEDQKLIRHDKKSGTGYKMLHKVKSIVN